ncbi:MAG TPA: CAP domain-containing protein [Nitrososphaerales archaeon]|nr:CAP domain-containing protein [Nitrososphaerales archaeon]
MESPQNPKKTGWAAIVATFLALLVIVAIILMLFLPSIVASLGNIVHFNGGYYTSTYGVNTYNNNNGGSTSPNSPAIYNSAVTITYPQDYQTLLNYTLGLINSDRANAGLSPVTASPIQSAQQHADSMLFFKYFSHWDTQGYKPYMRYTILNGTGFVEENVAYEYTSLPTYLNTGSVKNALATLENQMVYNDSACCNNGHRDNILNQYHNRVSIGIAYDSTHVYFVEDFETFYVQLNAPLVSSGNEVRLVGTTLEPINPNSIMVFYDSVPSNLSSSSLNTDYYGPYNQGNFVGGVLPHCGSLVGCPQYEGYITVYADNWQVNSSAVNIAFSLNSLVSKYGSGVYTIYMIQGSQNNPEYLTSLSIFETS